MSDRIVFRPSREGKLMLVFDAEQTKVAVNDGAVVLTVDDAPREFDVDVVVGDVKEVVSR